MNSLILCYQSLDQRASNFNRAIGKSIAWLTLAMVVLTAGIVIVRTLFNVGHVGAQELVTYLHATVIMLASAYTLAEQDHVRVDIFYRRLSPRGQAWVNVLGSTLFLLPFAVLSGVISWRFVSDAWAILEGSADAGGLPAVFILKSLLLANSVLLTLQALADICAQLGQLLSLDTTINQPTNAAQGVTTATTEHTHHG